MRKTARLVLAIVLLFGAIVVLPRPASRGLVPDALAQLAPTPTLPTLLPDDGDGGDDDPDPTPTLEPTDDPTDPPTGGGGGDDGGGGGGGDDGDGGGDGGKNPTVKNPLEGGNKNNNSGPGTGGKKKGPKIGINDAPGPSIAGRIPGAYDTNKLVAIAARLRSLGMSSEDVIRKVYPPFIIAGPASWIDTWGAPRYGPAPGQVRTHEGQDVFCDYGDPILAPTDGRVSFSDGGLGGLTARVHMANGDYWYMTHLSELNRKLRSGQTVEAGAVVGFCGTSGNAAGTSPHVHFGWYQEGGVNPRNPMKHLISWLRAAERRVLGVVTQTTETRQKRYESGALTAARRFGDSFVPDTSELRIPGESLWAAGSDPASGAFALAEAALQEALAGDAPQVTMLGSGLGVSTEAPTSSLSLPVDPQSALAQFLDAAGHSGSTHEHETGD